MGSGVCWLARDSRLDHRLAVVPEPPAVVPEPPAVVPELPDGSVVVPEKSAVVPLDESSVESTGAPLVGSPLDEPALVGRSVPAVGGTKPPSWHAPSFSSKSEPSR